MSNKAKQMEIKLADALDTIANGGKAVADTVKGIAASRRPLSELLHDALIVPGSNLLSGLGTAASSAYNAVSGYTEPTAQQAAQQKALDAAANKEIYKRVGKALAAVGMGGAGVGMSATRLHQLLGSANAPKQKHVKFAPGAQSVDDEEKLAADGAPDIATTLNDYMNSLATNVGQAVVGNGTPAKVAPGATTANMTESQKAWFMPALLSSGLLGIYGGHKLMNGIYENRRKEDLRDEVEKAKQEYERALLGKRAEILDAAFDKLPQIKTAEGENTFSGIVPTALRWATLPYYKALELSGLLPIYSTAVAGTGALSGKMMYDWTRERSRDKALERARRSRARLAGTAPIYVDPEQLAAVKKVVTK